MDGWSIYRGVFGGWGWERLDAQGEVIAESAYQFDSHAECIADAAARGFDPQSTSALQNTGGEALSSPQHE